MIQIGSQIKVMDNSGVKLVKCINFIKKKKKIRYLYWGNIFLGIMRTFRRYRRKLKVPIKKRRKCLALLLITKNKFKNLTLNCYLQIPYNYIAVFNLRGQPLSSRIYIKVPNMFRFTKYSRVIALAAGMFFC